MNFRFGASVLLLAVSSFAVSNVHAAGFEKNIMWGAKEAGTGGIGAPKTTGAKALYFNPAGLVQDEPGHEFSLDISPNSSQFRGPINYQSQESTSASTMTVPFSAMYGGAVDNNLGWGIGYYVSGGNRISFDDVPFPSTVVGKASAKTNLTITEVSAGLAYRVSDDLKLGLAWRGVMAEADFAMVSPIATAPSVFTFSNLHVNGLKASNFGGFKLGAQYQWSESTAMSFVYRSEASLKGDGKYGGVISQAGAMPIGETEAKGKIIFPMSASLGIQQDYESWRAMAEYVWTQYSSVKEIAFESPVVLANGAPVGAGPVINTEWNDQHSLKLGGEYIGMEWPIRFGYIWTSQVVPSNKARATFTTPGLAHTFTLGTGYKIDAFKFDTAAEYTFSSGQGEGAAAGQAADVNGNTTRAGQYSASAYALHLGVSYTF